eukprot:2992654-Pleurochrysis_carterae.AAC.3
MRAVASGVMSQSSRLMGRAACLAPSQEGQPCFGIEKSHGRKGREWTKTLSLGNARALSSLPGTGVPAKAAGGNKGCACLERSVIEEARKRRRQERNELAEEGSSVEKRKVPPAPKRFVVLRLRVAGRVLFFACLRHEAVPVSQRVN